MEFEIDPDKHKVIIDIHIDDIIDRMNKLDLLKRWQLICKILNHIEANEFEVLTTGQKIMILSFLEKNIKLYKYGIKK